MKIFTLSLAFLLSFSALQSQTTEDAAISLDNPEYLEWVSDNGFRFMSEIKPGEETFQASEIVDAEGEPLPDSVTPMTFDITRYDFETVVAPEKNIIIRVANDKAIFIYSKKRQEILFARYMATQSND